MLLIDSAKEIIRPERLLQISFSFNYNDRPYAFTTYKLLEVFFGNDIVKFRIFKSIFFAINACLMFIIIGRVSRLFALLGTLVYTTSAELWVFLAYNVDIGLYAQTAIFIAILLFLKLLDKKNVTGIGVWFYYLLIYLSTNYAVLAKGGDRYVSIIFLLVILVFRKYDLKYHILALITMLVLQLPVLGFITKLFLGFPTSSIINVAGYNTGSTTRTIFDIFITSIKNIKYARIGIGNLSLILLIVLLGLHLLQMLFKNRILILKKTNNYYIFLKERTFLFALWFFFSFMIIAIARGFAYSTYGFQMVDCSYFKGALIIFICYYSVLIIRGIKKQYRKYFLIGFVVLMLLQVAENSIRLIRYRGGWGNYFISWNNAGKHINNTSDSTLALTITRMVYEPFVLPNQNIRIIKNNAIPKNGNKNLFSILIKNGYIDEEGIILDSKNIYFNVGAEKNITKQLAQKYTPYKQKIINIFRDQRHTLSKDSPFNDLAYIERKFSQYKVKNIFVIKQGEVDFHGYSNKVKLINTTTVDGNSEDLFDLLVGYSYSLLRPYIKLPSRPLIYIYQFRAKY